MATGSNGKFHGGPLLLGRGRNVTDSTSYLLQPEMSPSTSQAPLIPLSPAYSYAGEMSPGSPYFPMHPGNWSSQSFSSQSFTGAGLPIYPIPEREMASHSDQPMLEHRAKQSLYNNKVYGVGDLEGVRIDGVSPTNKMTYDYADMGHQYEELPGGRKSMMGRFPMDTGGDTRSEYQSSGGATDIVSEADDTAGIVSQSEKRKRVNPLYDHMAQSVPSIYNKVKNEGDKKLRGQVRCLKCALVILIVLCCASIAISVTALLYKQTTEAPIAIKPTLEELVANYSQLGQLIMYVDQHTKSELDTIKKTLNFTADANYISLLETNLTARLAMLNNSIQERLEVISKMPGPQGPSGVGNLSMCSYHNRTNNSPASSSYPSYTPYAPSLDELQTSVVMFAACSTEGGTEAMLITNVLESNSVQYQCKCSGRTETTENRRFCHLHFWECPRYS